MTSVIPGCATRFGWIPILLFGVFSSCKTADGSSAGGAQEHNFQLSCDVVESPKAASLICLRLDTRNGDTKLIALPKVPESKGSTNAADKAAGTYQLSCHSTTASAKADVRCVRLDRETGEILLVDIGKIERYPK